MSELRVESGFQVMVYGIRFIGDNASLHQVLRGLWKKVTEARIQEVHLRLLLESC